MLEFISDLFNAGNSLKSNVYEAENGYVLQILMPGVNKEDIDLEVEDDNLKVSVKASDGASNDDKYLIHEFTSEASQRSFYLGEIDEESIKAKLVDGVLTILVAKKEPEASNKKTITID